MARKTSRKDVGAWLGGNRGTVQSRMPSVGASSDTEAKVDAGGGQMEQVRAELGLGAYAAGIGTTAAIGAGIAAARSPVGRRATRAVTQRKDIYVVHGSPTKGIKNIDPKFETMPSRLNADPPFAERWPEGVDPSTAAFYGHNVTSKGGSSRLLPRSDVRDVITDTTGYARGGSIYIARTPAKMWEGESSMAAARVVREVPVARTSQTVPYEQAVNQTVREVERQLKKLGFKYPKVPKKR